MIQHVGFLPPELVLAVRQSLPQHEGEFDFLTLRQTRPGSAHHATRSIFLRGPLLPLQRVEEWFQDIPQVDYLFLDRWPEMKRLLTHTASTIGKAKGLGKVMLVELPPLSGIDWHVDEGPYAEAHDRYHLAIETNPEASLYSGSAAAHVVPGELVWFRTDALHSAANASPSERRLHLIVDVRK